MNSLKQNVYLFHRGTDFPNNRIVSIHVQNIKHFNKLDSSLHEKECLFGLILLCVYSLLQDQFSPRNLFRWNGVFLEEGIEIVAGDNLSESIVLLNVFIDLCFVGVGIDLIVAVVLLGEVYHLQQDIKLLLIFNFCTLCRRQRHTLIHLIIYYQILTCDQELIKLKKIILFFSKIKSLFLMKGQKQIFYSPQITQRSQMKLSPPNHASEKGKVEALNKFRTVRESQPNFIPSQLLEDPDKIKLNLKMKNHKAQRQPRLSQADTPSSNPFLSPDFRYQQNRATTKHNFLSPPSILQAKMMKKTTNTIYLHSQTNSSKNILPKINSVTQFKNKKSPIKNHKQSLNAIEEMLINHGIKLNSREEKKVKSPRFSEPLIQQTQHFIFGRKKENDSLGSTIKNQSIDKGNLKQTISTLASTKSDKQLKITDFQLGKELGKGKFGRVIVARHKKTGMIFSIKIIKKSQIVEEKIIQQAIKEIKIQSFINHSHIIKLYSVFDDHQHVYLLLELCTEGNLYNLMQKKVKMAEDDAALILKEVCEGVNQLHEADIIHRDIKPENIVMCYGMAKICDFGWSTEIKQSLRQTFCGTPLYVSPELLCGNLYDEKIDLWSLGILGYEMMTGSIPFRIKSEKDLMKIVDIDIVFPNWMSSKAVAFLKSLLEKDPKKRIQISSLLNHEFLDRSKKK